MEQPEILGILKDRCETVLPGTGVLAAYLFGSGAEDRLREDSDLDVGVFTVAGEGMPLREELRLAARFSEGIDLPWEIDLRCLDRSDLAIQAAAMRGGLLWESDHHARCSRESLILRMDMDQRPKREQWARQYFAALARKGMRRG